MRLAPAILLTLSSAAAADPAVVERVEARRTGDAWTLAVTLRHGDTGWDDYADGWRVETADGAVLGERPLLHPHVDEQPFTRSQSGIAVPPGTTRVHVRARTSVEGWAADTTAVRLP